MSVTSQATSGRIPTDSAPAMGALAGSAYWISHIVSPPLVGLIALLICGWQGNGAWAWQWTGLYAVLSVLLPCAYIVWLVQRGQVTDFHLPVRAQRMGPLLVSALGAGVGWWLLHRGDGPSLLRGMAVVNALQAVAFLLITLRWKISLHTATVATLAMLIWALGGGWSAAALVPLVAWARVYLGRHTPAQTVAGAGLGAATGLLLVLYL